MFLNSSYTQLESEYLTRVTQIPSLMWEAGSSVRKQALEQRGMWRRVLGGPEGDEGKALIHGLTVGDL